MEKMDSQFFFHFISSSINVISKYINKIGDRTCNGETERERGNLKWIKIEILNFLMVVKKWRDEAESIIKTFWGSEANRKIFFVEMKLEKKFNANRIFNKFHKRSHKIVSTLDSIRRHNNSKCVHKFYLPRKSDGVPKLVAAAAAKCDKCNPGCSIAGTLVGRIGLEVVLSDGELLGDRLSDFVLHSNLMSAGFDAKMLSIVNVDDGIELLLPLWL